MRTFVGLTTREWATWVDPACCARPRAPRPRRLCFPDKEELLFATFQVMGVHLVDGVRYADMRTLDDWCPHFRNAKVGG